jgi:hypothetical protein
VTVIDPMTSDFILSLLPCWVAQSPVYTYSLPDPSHCGFPVRVLFPVTVYTIRGEGNVNPDAIFSW